MATLEQAVDQSIPQSRPRGESIFSRALKVLCSVRLGVTLLVILGILCFLGMVIMQQNVDGFDRYFASLTQAERVVYGRLGLFDIYHAWYFNALLCVLSLNIILASIDRFPKTWLFVSKPNLTVPVRWLKDQRYVVEFADRDAEVRERVSKAIESAGWGKPIPTEKGGKVFLFGQAGIWNRFGAYAVHVGLLTIFMGGFMTAQLGNTGQMPLAPGQTSDLMFETVVETDKATEVTKRLPFTITATDIEQKLIKKDGSLSAMNTIDWITRFTIKDEIGTHEGSVQMNRPFDYRGYRFFQASFSPVGRARNITLSAISGGAQPISVTIPRDGSSTLPDGTKVTFAEFRGNFRVGQDDRDEDTSAYPNPAAVLQITSVGGQTETAYAFPAGVGNIPVAERAVAGYKFQLVDFEKVADQHILAVQRDPGASVVYVGFVILFLTLAAVFLFSHQRVWAVIEPDGTGGHHVLIAANTNRNAIGFDEKFRRFSDEVGGKRI